MRGAFVVFEGGDASGKSTQAARLANAIGALATREPGGTAIGELIREQVLHAADPADRTEALLMAAARAQHVAEVIRPALDAGRHVVCDRFTGSSLAYQGAGRGLSIDDLRALSAFATGGLEPDLVILLDLDPAEARRRLSGPGDRLEEAGAAFHARVREGYLAQAAGDPRWVVVDAGASRDEVAAAVDLAWQRLGR